MPEYFNVGKRRYITEIRRWFEIINDDILSLFKPPEKQEISTYPLLYRLRDRRLTISEIDRIVEAARLLRK